VFVSGAPAPRGGAAAGNPLPRAIFRQINDRIRELSEQWPALESREFLCECGDRTCTRAIRLSLAEYDAIRADPARFVVAADHSCDPHVRVVERRAHFAVIDAFASVPNRSTQRRR
jgi:hypothetical protein